jgi:hypothetical protein
MGKTTSRPICLACHRPFDPFSPGATATMGPTCAKKAQIEAAHDEASPQMNLMEEPRSAVSVPPRKNRPTTELASSRFTGRSSGLGSPARVPSSLAEAYHLAKIAFDDLYREFCAPERLHEHCEAQSLLEKLEREGFERIRLADPVLEWLEPEHDLSLFLGLRSGRAYHVRVLNGVLTVLDLEPRTSAFAHANIQTILRYHKLLTTFREREARVQLTLGDLLAPVTP